MTNPLLEPWDGPFGLPDFSRVEPAHFRPAYDAALAEQQAEFEAIRDNPEPATFANTIEALERAGRMLDRVGLSTKLAMNDVAPLDIAGLTAVEVLYDDHERDEPVLVGRILRDVTRSGDRLSFVYDEGWFGADGCFQLDATLPLHAGRAAH